MVWVTERKAVAGVLHVLETVRLRLRPWSCNDAKALYDMCLDDELRRNGVCFYDSPEDARGMIRAWERDDKVKAVVRKEDDRVIGFVYLGEMNRYEQYNELEYAIAADCRNCGYAAEAIVCMVDFAFGELGLSVVAASARGHNAASARVLQKCGFVHEGTLRRHARDRSDTLYFSVLREEWEG